MKIHQAWLGIAMSIDRPSHRVAMFEFSQPFQRLEIRAKQSRRVATHEFTRTP
ncbi:MAG TPA: hypothetical protein VI306_09505 [Pyrinomonadaceae bacterium]